MITVGMMQYMSMLIDLIACSYLKKQNKLVVVVVVEVVVCVHSYEKKLAVYIVSKLLLLIQCDKRSSVTAC